jgi:hypothetical protein
VTPFGVLRKRKTNQMTKTRLACGGRAANAETSHFVSHRWGGLGVRQSLRTHDSRVRDARPHREPDKARVRQRVATGNQQKYSQRCIDSRIICR